MRRIIAMAATAVISGVLFGPAAPASARSYDTWSAVSAALGGSQTPWEPRRTLGLTRDPKLGIDVTRCKGKKGSAIRVRYASPKARRMFYTVQQPNGVACVKTTMAGYGKVGMVKAHGFVFDIYARCGKTTCPKSSVAKRGMVQMRPAGPGATVSTVRIATKGLSYDEVMWVTEGLTLNTFN
jgi:hypothetical protein